jgi:hypothetical protein
MSRSHATKAELDEVFNAAVAPSKALAELVQTVIVHLHERELIEATSVANSLERRVVALEKEADMELACAILRTQIDWLNGLATGNPSGGSAKH